VLHVVFSFGLEIYYTFPARLQTIANRKLFLWGTSYTPEQHHYIRGQGHTPARHHVVVLDTPATSIGYVFFSSTRLW
jgi:hypothetical protein